MKKTTNDERWMLGGYIEGCDCDQCALIQTFNTTPAHATDFQRLLSDSGCCADGKVAVGSKTPAEHWFTEGEAGETARYHMMRFASGLQVPMNVPFIQAPCGILPSIVNEWINGRILHGRVRGRG